MPVLCIGPVCIPLNLLLPILLGIAHKYGWLKWIRGEWLTLTWWKQQFSRQQQQAPGAAAGTYQAAGKSSAAGGPAAPPGMQYVCEGDVCRMVPVDEASNKQQDSSSSAVSAAGGARQRKGLVGMKATDL